MAASQLVAGLAMGILLLTIQSVLLWEFVSSSPTACNIDGCSNEEESLVQVRKRLHSSGKQDPVPADPCTLPCGGGIPDPEEPGNNNAGALGKFIQSSVRAVTIPWNTVGGLSKGGPDVWVWSGTTFLDGLRAFSASSSPSPSQWAVYKLTQNLVTMQDYLVCQFQSIMGAFYSDYIDEINLKTYNNQLQALQQDYYTNCGVRACLNLSGMPGDERNAVVPGCCTSMPVESKDCSSKGKAGKVCSFPNPEWTGICGTDGKCWGCTTTIQVVNKIEEWITRYSDTMSQGEMLSDYKNIDAIIAYSKGVTFVHFLYESLFLFGAANNPGARSVEFARQSVAWINKKIDEMMAYDARWKVVNDSSTFTDAKYTGGCSDMGGYYHGQYTCTFDLSTRPGYKVRYGCDRGSWYEVRLWATDRSACSASCAPSLGSPNVTAAAVFAVATRDQPCEDTYAIPGAEWSGDGVTDSVCQQKCASTPECNAATLFYHADNLCRLFTQCGTKYAEAGTQTFVLRREDPAACNVQLFVDKDYQGQSQEYTGDQSYVGEAMNDEASSIKLGPSCSGIVAHTDADMQGYTEWLTVNTPDFNRDGPPNNPHPKDINDQVSSFQIWTEGQLVNQTSGCTCQSIEPSDSTMGPWTCPLKVSRSNCGKDDDPASMGACLGWSKTSTQVTGREFYGGCTDSYTREVHSREFQSFNTSFYQAIEKLKDVYNEQLQDVYTLVNSLQEYIDKGGVARENFGAYDNMYPGAMPDQCPQAEAPSPS